MVHANADLGDFSGHGDTEGEELILVVAKAKTTTLKKKDLFYSSTNILS